MSAGSVSPRDRILDAVATVLVRDGGNAVTIAAVAAEAEVSKGGLFYHFASKELLLEGLVDRYIEAFDALIDQAGDGPGDATRAYLHSAQDPAGPAGPSVAAVLAAAVAQPHALQQLRAHCQVWQERLENDGIPNEIAMTIRFAVDGLWLSDTLHLAPPDRAARQDVITRLAGLLP